MSDTRVRLCQHSTGHFSLGWRVKTLAHVNLGCGIFGGEWFERYRTFLFPRQENPFCLSERYSIFCSADFLGPAQNSQAWRVNISGSIHLLSDC